MALPIIGWLEMPASDEFWSQETYPESSMERAQRLENALSGMGERQKITRQLKCINWTTKTLASLSADSSCNHSSVKSLSEDLAKVQLSSHTVRRADLLVVSELLQGTDAGFDSYPSFDNAALASSRIVQCPPTRTGAASQTLKHVISGSVTKRSSSTSKPNLSLSKLSRAIEEPPAHWRVEGPNWACPFAVHDPPRYWRVGNACIEWQGFRNINRLREHLRDVHYPQKLCPNCLANFHKSDKKLQDHIAKRQCKKREQVPLDQPEPLTLEQRAVLLKNFDAGTSEEDKWRGYYHVLFPNDPGYKSISPYFNWQLLPRRMSKVAAVDHDAETSPKSPDQASQTPESLSIETVPFETGTTATTITTTEQDTATTKPYISTELSTTYYWDPQPDSWDPQLDTTGEPLKNDDAETVDPGLLDPDYTITGVYARYDQSETTLFGPDGVNLFSNPTKHPQRVGEAKIVDDFDQGLTSFEFDL